MEHFIESVRKYPCLWATNSEEYKINEIKDAAWRNVIKECDLPDIKEAKNLWKKLRDGHRQSLNKRKTTTGQAADKDKGWKCDKLMEFLIPYMANMPRTTNAEPLAEQADSLQTQEFENAKSSLEENATISRKRKSDDSVIKYLDEEKKARDKRATERDQLRRQILTRQKPPKDVMKSFFDTMYEMSKNLSENFQMKIQNEVFKTVMHAREKNSKAMIVYNISGAGSFTLPPPAPHPGTSYLTHSSQPSSYLTHSSPPSHSELSPESHIYHVTSPPPRPGTSYSTHSSLSSHSVLIESDVLSPPCQPILNENDTSTDGHDIRSYLTDDATYDNL